MSKYETRVLKYKQYRNSFLKEGAPVVENPENVARDLSFATTTALPINEVIKSASVVNEETLYYKKRKRQDTFLFISLITISLLIIVGLIIFGIFAFRS
ncbi:MAG: hypothetical protein MJ227_01815 [Bacilli bacterium]|nr:hypothetical protein [Bacilli bacterium]